MRPVVEAIVADLVATDSFQGVFHAGVRELHTAIVEGRRSRLLVEVDDAGPIVKEASRRSTRQFADSIPDVALDVAVGVSQSTPLDTTMRLSSLAGWLALPLAIAAATCLTMAARRAADRRRAIETIGLVLVATGAAHFAILSVGVNLAASLGADMRQRTALRAVFWSVTHLINVQAKVVITIGTVLAIAAAYAGTGRIRSRLGSLLDAVRWRLGQPLWRALACLAAIAAGFFAMRWPEATAAITIRVVAFVGFVVGADRSPRRPRLGRLGPRRLGPGAADRPAPRHRRDGRDLAGQRVDPVRRPGVRPGRAGTRRAHAGHGVVGLQRQLGALRPAPRRGRVRRHAQLDGGERRGLLLPRQTGGSGPSSTPACGRS